MHRRIVLLGVFAAASAVAAPMEADHLWEAQDGTLSITVPAESGYAIEDLREDPEPLLAAFRDMVGEEAAEPEVTDHGIRSVTREEAVEEIEVEGEPCYRRVTRLSEVNLGFDGLLTRIETEEFGQAYSLFDHTECPLPPSGLSSASYVPGTWRHAEGELH